MKKLTFLLLLTGVCSFAQTAIEKTKFTASIANRTIDTLVIEGPQYSKKIAVNTKGQFQDELSIKSGFHRLTYGKNMTTIYLMPGKDIDLNTDENNFNEKLSYKGKGANENNYLSQLMLRTNKFMSDIFTKDQLEFDKAVTAKSELENKTIAAAKLDPAFKENISKSVESTINRVKKVYVEKQKSTALIGKPALDFEYENHKGGKTKLSDLRGKYVYIDIWATWCGPCKYEIPFLQKIEEKYHGKNIEFVSISVDVEKDHEKWKNMVTEKQLGGIQLIADKNWNSEFITTYGINGIPRFMLIDPQGNFVSNDADRPSNPNLATQLDSLLNK
ncbi:TlpA family protein disulfide reductase [Flavobacterium flavipallidum]|uniref:TlpA disulfide reductase family protein n=1 Tax=Flavobacterium flavipallidum TaxID=3139140 RepID=A0ABU9HJT4_9FLAO